MAVAGGLKDGAAVQLAPQHAHLWALPLEVSSPGAQLRLWPLEALESGALPQP
jgi:hypothetical protein